MISEENYKRMATEVLEIIKLYSKDTREKIPKKLIAELEKNKLSDLNVQLDKSKKLHEQDICDESVVLVYMIYRNYIAKPDEKEYFDSILNKFDEETKKQYDPKNLFKDNKEIKLDKGATAQDR